MTEIVYVKPNKGASIRQPERGFAMMPETGAFVGRDSYYERMIMSGDLAITDAPSETELKRFEEDRQAAANKAVEAGLPVEGAQSGAPSMNRDQPIPASAAPSKGITDPRPDRDRPAASNTKDR